MSESGRWPYYDGIDGLCNRLRSAAAPAWAESLAAATQGGAPSNEILDRTGTLLRSLSQSPDPAALGVVHEVQRLLVEQSAL